MLLGILGCGYYTHTPNSLLLPLRLRPVKGRKLFPLTGLVFAAYTQQRGGSAATKRPCTG